jgi:hypothetical protein
MRTLVIIVRNVARNYKTNVYRPWYRQTKESDHLENLGVDREVPRILKKQDEGVWTRFISFGSGKNGGLLYKRG